MGCAKEKWCHWDFKNICNRSGMHVSLCAYMEIRGQLEGIGSRGWGLNLGR